MSKRNYFLDIAKGFSILMVIVTHFSWSDGERLRYLFPFWIGMAVPIFLIISGYVSAASFEKNGIHSIGQAYDAKLLVHKFVRYTTPFLFAYAAELIFETVCNGAPSLKTVFEQFLRGGIGGAGTYYYPILIQFIFLFPIIYFIVKRKKHGLMICFILNVLYELLEVVYEMSSSSYRLLIFRYIMLIAFGCYLYLNDGNRLGRKNWLLLFAGTAFIIVVCYMGCETYIIRYWKKTCVFAILFILPVFSLAMKYMKNVRCRLLELLGQASYHIFFTQMVYYNYADDITAAHLPNRAAHLAFNLVFCVIVGIIFYYVESPISKFVMKKTDQMW